MLFKYLRNWAPIIAGVFLGFSFGTALTFLDVPLGWLLGALLSGGIVSNFFTPLGETKKMRRAGQLLIGTATVGTLSPEILKLIIELLPLMLGAAVAANIVGVLMALPFIHFTRLDRLTALLSCLPAGAAEMASLAADFGGRVEVVTASHTIRVVIVVLTVPILVGISGSTVIDPNINEESFGTLALCLVGGGLLAVLGTRFKILSVWILAPISVGVLLVSSGYSVAIMPPWMLILAQLLIGFSLGTKLNVADFFQLRRAVIFSVLTSLALIFVMILLIAPIVTWMTDVDLVTSALSVAPGGLGEMIAAAKFNNATVGIVVGFQLVRAVATNLIMPPIIIRFAANPNP
ncbi:AbrB family transcriptional regulator [Pacificibacter marinus]|uniref:AbrB family transcriptional regulator n=1 Tax=Pacificibacter marinus TaxID=658057 RepID=UPI001C076FBF|nr:AbrB family transcriptional regulator [Pacificibacter marinus]MBU2867456.1 AbrB family transcriptional regulator [Pacificibacter marinus]